MNRQWLAVVGSLAVSIVATTCDRSPTSPDPQGVDFTFDFRQGAQGWSFDAARYVKGSANLTGEYRPLSGALSPQGSALFAEGLTLGTVPVMFFKRLVAGLIANHAYEVAFSVEIATNTPGNCLGFGDSPGEGTFVKAGATTVEPVVVEEPTSTGGIFVRADFDLGSRSKAGVSSVVLGHIANTRQCPDYSTWELKPLQSDATIHIVADANGRAWLFQAVDPGFEGRISVYFTRFAAKFNAE